MNPLRVAFAAVVRPAFKGDGAAVAARAFAAFTRVADASHAQVAADLAIARDATEAAAIGARLQGANPDLLVITHATFATGDLLTPLLAAAPRVVVWGVPEIAGARAGGPNGVSGPLPLNSFCGVNMTLSFAESERGGARGPVAWCYGDPDDPRVHARLQQLFAAERGAKALRDARILAIGGTAPGFYGLDLPHPQAGAVVIERPLSALFERIAVVDDDTARAHARSWAAEEPLSAPEAHLVTGARIDLALSAMAREVDANALAVRCWPEIPEQCNAMACAAMGRAGDRGLPAACEGDVWGALAMRVLAAVANAPSALLDLSDIDEARDAILLWHCGNAPRSFASQAGTRLTTHFNRDGVGVVRDQTLTPGAATALRLLPPAQVGAPMGAVVVAGDILETQGPSFDGVRGLWGNLVWGRERVGVMQAVASVLDHRLPHHLALAPGDTRQALLALAERLAWNVLPASAHAGDPPPTLAA